MGLHWPLVPGNLADRPFHHERRRPERLLSGRVDIHFAAVPLLFGTRPNRTMNNLGVPRRRAGSGYTRSAHGATLRVSPPPKGVTIPNVNLAQNAEYVLGDWEPEEFCTYLEKNGI